MLLCYSILTKLINYDNIFAECLIGFTVGEEVPEWTIRSTQGFCAVPLRSVKGTAFQSRVFYGSFIRYRLIYKSYETTFVYFLFFYTIRRIHMGDWMFFLDRLSVFLFKQIFFCGAPTYCKVWWHSDKSSRRLLDYE